MTISGGDTVVIPGVTHDVQVELCGVGPQGATGSVTTYVQPDEPPHDLLVQGDIWIKKPPVLFPQPVFMWDGTEWVPLYGEYGPTSGYYEHIQDDPAAQWSITHLLHYKPSVTVENDAGNDVRGSVTYVDDDHLTINFSEPIGGRAYLGARTQALSGPAGEPGPGGGGITGIEGLPAGALLCVHKDVVTGFWPTGYNATTGAPVYTDGSGSAGVRPTARSDITVMWAGPEPSPPSVASGTAGMRIDVDLRFVTT